MRGPGAALVLSASFLLAGCTVPVDGVTGVGVDAEGAPVGYLRVCQHQIDGATLYPDNQAPEDQADADGDVGSWAARQPVTDYATWSLVESGSGWEEQQPMRALVDSKRYTLYGWTEDNSSSSAHITFSLEELSRLRPSQVLYHGTLDGEGREVRHVVSVEEFRRTACNTLGR